MVERVILIVENHIASKYILFAVLTLSEFNASCLPNKTSKPLGSCKSFVFRPFLAWECGRFSC